MRQLMSFKKFLDAGAPNIFFESFEEEVTEDLSGKAKVQKLKKLETLLKGHDWWFTMSDDRRAYKKGSAEQDAIRKLVDEIGSEGMKLYRAWGKKKGVMESSDKTKPKLSGWEKLLFKKLKEWGLQSLEDLNALEPEPRKRFNDELDKEWASSRENKTDVVFNESTKKPNSPRTLSEAVRQVQDRNGFPEMQNVQGRGTLDYAVRQVGDKSLTASTFGGNGELYPEHLSPKWQAPSPQRKRGWADK